MRFRIYALEEFKVADPNNIGSTVVIEEGDAGGLVFDDGRLLQSGCAWIFHGAAVEGFSAVVGENAVLAGSARLKDRATIAGNAIVRGNAEVSGGASVYGDALVDDATVKGNNAAVYDRAVVDGSGVVVEGNARVYEDAYISGNAKVYGDAEVYGTSRRVRYNGTWQTTKGGTVQGDAHVYGDAHVRGNAVVQGDARVYSDAKVSGNAVVEGKAHVSGYAKVFGDALVKGDAKVSGNIEVTGTALLAEPLKDGGAYNGSDCSSSTPVCRYDGDKEYKRAADEIRSELAEELQGVLYDCLVWKDREKNKDLDEEDRAKALEALSTRAQYGANVLVHDQDKTRRDEFKDILSVCEVIDSVISVPSMLTESLTAMLVQAALDVLEGGTLAVSPYAYALLKLGRASINAALIAAQAKSVQELIGKNDLIDKIMEAESLEDSLKQINEQAHRNS